MKAKISPTSPKYKVKELEKLYTKDNLKQIEKPKKKLRGELVLVLIISLIFGFLAGILGKIAIDYFVANYPEYTLNILNTNSDSKNGSRSNETKNKPSLYGEITQDVSPSQVNIFLKKENSESPLGNAYLPDDSKGAGMIVSNDGLIVTTRRVIDDFNNSYVVVTSDKTIYEASNLIHDIATDLVFLKIKAKNLKVAQFTNYSDLFLGETSLVLKNQHNLDHDTLIVTEITDFNHRELNSPIDLIQSTEKFKGYLRISDRLDNTFEGSLLIDLDGKVIGLYTAKGNSGNNLFIPVKNIESVINPVLSEEEIQRPYLGLSYIDLSRAINLPSDLTSDLKKGVLIYGDEESNIAAVEKLSPAEKGGFLEGDIIIKVGDKEINSDVDFTQLIQDKEIGETLNFTIKRSESEKDISVKLGKL